MKFIPTTFDTAWLIEPERHADERGFFARTWCQREFADHGLNPDLVQSNVSFNRKKGTLRGMHFQVAPYEEAKLVRCTQGAIFDVIIDLREDAATFGEWQGFELTAGNRQSLFIPEGFAHGFQSLEAGTEVFYPMSHFYQPEAASGIAFSDEQLGIDWPLTPTAISQRDLAWPTFKRVAEELQGQLQ